MVIYKTRYQAKKHARGNEVVVKDDETYQEIGIYCDNADQANEYVIKLVTELLKGD